MQNPYAQPAAQAAATPEQQKLSDYELAIGRNVAYYLPKFESYDAGGSTISWHWPAFFVTSGWYLYRKMWLWGLLNLFFPFIASIAVGMLAALLKLSGAAVGFAMLAAIFVEQILLTVFANALYWRHVDGIIRNVPRTLADKPDKRMRRIEREGGTSIGAMIGILFGVGIFGSGILAAIAIPAYQDYTIRAQVAEGLNLASGPKGAVAEYYAQTGEWPLDLEAVGLSPITGRYVESVTVANGSVVIAYGAGANRNIVYERLILAPGVTDHGDVIWMCGDQPAPPDVVTQGPGPRGSNVQTKYLPSQCRPSSGT
jgi:type IV pilus assembly protein PilA